MRDLPRRAIVDRLSRYDSLLEVGIGVRAEVAAGLVDAGREVVALDVVPRDVPPGVEFVRDDVVERSRSSDPTRGGRYDVDAVYGLNLPPELHRPVADLARAVDADCLFTTLGYDGPAVPVDRVPVGADTLYVVRERR